MNTLQKAGVPAGIVASGEDLLAQDHKDGRHRLQGKRPPAETPGWA